MAENTFFGEIHKELNAKTIPCGKWNMPLFYPGGSVAEHRHFYSGAVIFDRSMVRCFQISGKRIGELLDEIFLSPVSDMPVGGCRENVLLNGDGTFALIFTLCRMQDDDFMLLGDSGIADKEWSYLRNVLPGTDIRELDSVMAQLAVSGSKSAEILQAAGAETLPDEDHWQMITLKDADGDEYRTIAIHTKLFGKDSFHLCFDARYALEVYGALYEVPGIAPAGIGAWESLRIENGQPAAPQELKSTLHPADCGLGQRVDMTRNFAGKTALAGVKQAFKLFLIKLDRHPAEPGTIVELSGKAAGTVTSSAYCPVAGCALAICRIDALGTVKNGDKTGCAVNGKNIDGDVVREIYR